ncbi:hypothetical protein PUN28_010680 [Cardiocondyla obscurior]|uniref:Uncharacterized protein n=1 Tax=Cardiocondyla obscurior TaxID=286306 RepID=A0AAW2FN42_9HYME
MSKVHFAKNSEIFCFSKILVTTTRTFLYKQRLNAFNKFFRDSLTNPASKMKPSKVYRLSRKYQDRLCNTRECQFVDTGDDDSLTSLTWRH